jgi:hypothetical protein
MKRSYTQYILLLAFALLQSCSTAPVKPKAKSSNNKIKSAYAKLGNFDKVFVPNDTLIISEMIGTVQPELDPTDRFKFANNIQASIAKHKVEPQIMVALIDTESDFQYTKISDTGDLSLGQVNVEVWNKEFDRLKIPLIKREDLLRQDQSYAMDVMGRILAILKKRHGKKDRRWYARYHSNTTKYKLDYLRKIEIRMQMLSQIRSIAMK